MDKSEIISRPSNNIEKESLDTLCKKSIALIKSAKSTAAREANFIQILTYYILGKWIIEVQQGGKNRAKYGKNVLKILSDALSKEFGKGYSVSNLTNMRKFYMTYKERISEPLVTKFVDEKSQPLVTILDADIPFKLSWTHYLISMRIQDQDERDFYEELAVRENWGKRELSRQYGSSLISFRAGYRIYLCSKAEKLKHQDLGQMQMYVNYFDRYEKTESENPTIGILLCPQKNDAMVELTLPKDSNIYASQYQLYLPDKKLLQKKLQEWIEEETGDE